MHFVASSFSLGGVTFLFGGDAQVVYALGRQANFTGRTEIWAAVIPTVPNSIIGAGFESFWIAPNVEMMWRTLSDSGWWNPEELDQAHSGYIEIYLNLGWVGVCLIVLLLISGYRRAVRTFQRYLEVGSLLLAYIATSAIYSVTEAGFRELKPSWISLLLALVAPAVLSPVICAAMSPVDLLSRAIT